MHVLESLFNDIVGLEDCKLIWVGFEGFNLRLGEGRGKNTPYLKLVEIMQETWNLVHK